MFLILLVKNDFGLSVKMSLLHLYHLFENIILHAGDSFANTTDTFIVTSSTKWAVIWEDPDRVLGNICCKH